MIKKGGKSVSRLYKGRKHIIRLYKGLQLIHRYVLDAIEAYIAATSVAFSTTATAMLRKMSTLLRVDVSAKSEEHVSLSKEQNYLNYEDCLVISENAVIKNDAVCKIKAYSNALIYVDVKGGIGYTEKIKADEISFTTADAILTEHSDGIQAEEQYITSKDTAHAGRSKAAPHTAEEQHILLTQKAPTASSAQAMSQPVEQEMHITDTVNGGTGKAGPQKAETYGLFSLRKPYLFSQTIMPIPQYVKMHFAEFGKMIKGKVRPHAAETRSIFAIKPVGINFGYSLPIPEKIELNISNTVSGGAGRAKPQTAKSESNFKNLVQLTDETTGITAEAGVLISDVAVFEKGHSSCIEAENNIMSDFDSIVYTPNKLLKTDMLIQSGVFARLFRVVQMYAETKASMSHNAVLYPDKWVKRQGNTLIIYKAKNAIQDGTTLKIDIE